MRDVETDFPRLLRALEESGVRYVLVGGLAMVAHGSAHVTVDLDVGYARDLPNLEAVIQALAPLDPYLRGAPEGLPFRWDVRTLKGGQNFTLETDAGAIDLLADLAGSDSFEGLWSRAAEMNLFGHRVRVASISDLIAMKRAAGRFKDLAHIEELESLQRLIAQQGSSDAS